VIQSHSYLADCLSHAPEFSYGIIMGLPKTGTTLPLTLLDGHPRALVFPEELRFMDSSCQKMDDSEACGRLLSNGNIKFLQSVNKQFQHLSEHGGSGYGKRDYSDLNFSQFEQIIRAIFDIARNPFERYFGIFLGYELARGGDLDSMRCHPVLISKAPHNEQYLFSWQQMLGASGRFLCMVRNPLELYLSQCNIAREAGKECVKPEVFAQSLASRFRLLDLSRLADHQLRIQRYEDLIADTAEQMKQVALFFGLGFNVMLLRPTKNSVPWEGNSSRGIRAAQVFENPQKAQELLPKNQLTILNRELSDLLARFGYTTNNTGGD